jgi:hypothetical protein
VIVTGTSPLDDDEDDGVVEPDFSASRRQRKTWLALTSYWRATTETEAPGKQVAATISRFSADGHRLFRRRRFSPFVSTSDIVGTSSHHVDPHQRGRLDHGTSRDKAVLTGGRQ